MLRKNFLLKRISIVWNKKVSMLKWKYLMQNNLNISWAIRSKIKIQKALLEKNNLATRSQKQLYSSATDLSNSISKKRMIGQNDLSYGKQ